MQRKIEQFSYFLDSRSLRIVYHQHSRSLALSLLDEKRDHFIREIYPFSKKYRWALVAHKENTTAGKLSHPSGAAVANVHTSQMSAGT